MTRQHVTDYAVLTSDDPRDLEKKVATALHAGWQPFGSLCINPRGDGFASVYAQAIVQYADRF